MQYIISSYHQATNRVILLDFDGTLVNFDPDPMAVKPPGSTLNILKRLAQNPANTVAIISGRNHQTLEDWLGHLPVIMYAEHGLLRRDAGKKWHSLVPKDTPWRAPALALFEQAVQQVPGSFIEEKTAGIVWQYRSGNSTVTQKTRKQLLKNLTELGQKYHFEVLDGNKVIEVKPAGTNKGSAVSEILAAQKPQPNFILSAGDDVTDEAMFAATPPNGFTIKVGKGPTLARHRAATVEEFLSLLHSLAQ